MKGFFIEVTNNLLDPHHTEAMGSSVWEFMWCLDKITMIDEDGIGWVWGRKPVLLEDIVKEIGGSTRNAKRNMARLEKAGYLIRIRTPRGMQIGVRKAKKRFGRKPSEVPKMAQRGAKNGTSNIRQYKDTNKRMRTSSTFAPSEGKVTSPSMEYIPIDEDGREQPVKRTGPKPEGKNKIAMRIQLKFIAMAEDHLGSKPIMDVKGYKMCLYAMNTGGLTEQQIGELFEEWFNLDKSDSERISITRALSARQIEGYKVRNGVK